MFVRLLLVGLFLSAATFASARTYSNDDDSIMPTGDRWVPFPRSLAQPIPWSEVQGLWKVQERDYVSYFSFRVTNDRLRGLKQVQIKQFEGDTCRVLSHGVGIEKDGKFVIGKIVSDTTGKAYRIQVSAFLEHDFPMPIQRGDNQTAEVLLLSLGNIEDKFPDEMAHVQILKVSESITQSSCFADVRR